MTEKINGIKIIVHCLGVRFNNSKNVKKDGNKNVVRIALHVINYFSNTAMNTYVFFSVDISDEK